MFLAKKKKLKTLLKLIGNVSKSARCVSFAQLNDIFILLQVSVMGKFFKN